MFVNNIGTYKEFVELRAIKRNFGLHFVTAFVLKVPLLIRKNVAQASS